MDRDAATATSYGLPCTSDQYGRKLLCNGQRLDPPRSRHADDLHCSCKSCNSVWHSFPVQVHFRQRHTDLALFLIAGSEHTTSRCTQLSKCPTIRSAAFLLIVEELHLPQPYHNRASGQRRVLHQSRSVQLRRA